MRFTGLPLLFLIATLSLHAYAADVTVNINLAAPNALEVSYDLPQHCLRLPFVNTGPDSAAVRAAWRAQDGCASANGAELARTGASCKKPSFRLLANTDRINGMYSPAYPIGAGIYTHTSAYAVTGACGSVAYRFVAPGIALDGKAWQGSAQAAPSTASHTAALLLPAPMPASEIVPTYIDPALGVANIAHIHMVADDTISYLRKKLPDAPFRMPILAAALVHGPGGPQVDGDAADVLRLALINWPQQPDPAVQRLATLFISHEFSHRFEPPDAADAYANARLIHEGSAEFLRWRVGVEEGWLSHKEAASDLDDALTRCLLGTGQASWGTLTQQAVAAKHLEYSCGLAAYVYGLAARQGPGDAFARMNNFYRQLGAGAHPDFARALECGTGIACEPRWLPRLLGTAQPMQMAWGDLFDATGLARPVPAGPVQMHSMMEQAFGQLMREDCGSTSYFLHTDGIIVDDVPGCRTLRAKMDITTVEHLPVFGNIRALPAMLLACHDQHQLHLGLKDGRDIKIACSHTYAAPKQFYAVDIERVLASLNRP